MQDKLTKKYGLFTAICLVAGTVIGSGIFFKAQTVLQKTGGNMPLGILAWLIGGLIMIVCIFAFSAMAQKYEKVNGLVDYAEATMGKKYAYYVGWFSSFIYYPSMTSALAWLSARYTLVFLKSVAPNFPLLAFSGANSGSEALIGPECMVLMLFYLVASYTVNALSPKLAGKIQVSATIIKLIPLILMAVGGIIYGLVSGTLTQNFSQEAVGYVTDGNPLLSAVCATAFAYEGWIIVTTINAELKDSKRNLPKALIIGGLIIISVYIFYYVGVAGGETNQTLADKGATTAFTRVFGNVFGNILNLFVAISCLGTMNGLMIGCCRGLYSLAARRNGPKPDVFSQLDPKTNCASNSSVIGLLTCTIWIFYFFFSNLAKTWTGPFVFDSTELPIITIYGFYIPIFISWIRKEKGENKLRRFVIPILALIGCLFMIYACLRAHGIACFWYLIVFTIIMLIGGIFYKKNADCIDS